jgi:hypothetical protein
MQLHKKSLALGALIGVIATLALGAANSSGAGPVGKYQAIFGPGTPTQGFVVVIDTTTGKLWRGVVSQHQQDPGWEKEK